MSSERDDVLLELEQRLAQVGRKLSAEDASSLIAEDLAATGSGFPFLQSRITANIE